MTLPTLTAGDRAWLFLLALYVAAVCVSNYAPELFHLRDYWPDGPISFFGVSLALDLLFAFHIYERWIRALGWPRERALWVGIATVAAGLIGSHVMAIVAYHPDSIGRVSTWLDLRVGMSSFGGLIGGGLAAAWLLRRSGFPVLRGFDAMIHGFVGGYVFGRAGCFFIHDHPGQPSDFPLAVVIDGVRRHDLGGYEMVLMAALLVLLEVLGRRGVPAGRVFAVACLTYAPVRFAFETLRVGDARYADLTPAQWCCLFVLPLGIAILWHSRDADAPHLKTT